MADEIRQALARLAEPVVPRPDPYQRLLVRVGRRRQRRMAVTCVAGLVAVAMALPVFGAAGRLTVTGVASSPPPAVGTYQPASRIDKPMVRQLLDSPTRGNLAGDKALIADIGRQYRTARAELLVDPTLDEVKVLLAHDAPGARTVVVAFLDDSHAVLRHGSGQAGASVPELLRKTGTPDEPQPLEPHVFYGRYSPVNGRHVADLTVGLAPAGCLVEASADGRIQPDGSVSRSWQVVSTDGFVVRGAGRATERWRFTCHGLVRYAGPAGGGLGVVSPTEAASPVSTAGARGSVNARLAATAVRDLRRELDGHGLIGSTPQVIWGGRLPDWVSGAPAAVLVNSCSADAGCAALLKTEAGPPSQPESGSPTDYWTATGRPDLVVVQVPGETGGVLVFGPESAVHVELLDRKGRKIASGRFDAGAGAVRIDPRQVVEVQVFDTDRRLLRTGATPNLGADFSQRLGEPTVWAW
ncbi:hypothetical protein AB0D32_26095 [Micromonospora sp. NPDC048170]|uniref:hypothetical protein n=1 Tax=Micromonospora sp. NPDC048170 TaxID=3154819 RepID=UPI0033EB1636